MLRKEIFTIIWLGMSCCLSSNLLGLNGDAVTNTDPTEVVLVTSVDCGVVRRTNCRWLTGYLGLKLPAYVSHGELNEFRSKILTTGVFTKAHLELIAADQAGEEVPHELRINLDEKWTTIPVIRGAYGGGTPLRVFGVYDTHSFGSLWTLGGETRLYGDAPPSYVVWASAPRWGTGKHVISAEFWRFHRVRDLYDENLLSQGQIQGNRQVVRLMFMHPIMRGALTSTSDKVWQLGIDAKVLKESPASFSGTLGSNFMGLFGLDLPDEQTTHVLVQPRVAYDDTKVENVTYDGLRFVAQAGPIFTGDKTKHRFEVDVYHYKRLAGRFNLAVRTFLGGSTSSFLPHQFFLGGFDTVRGIPDGAMHGTRAGFANFELRHLSKKWRYLWLQSLVFMDAGAAGPAWSKLRELSNVSAGFGFRLAIPQVYRLMFRFDYAWSLNQEGVHGITAGLNHFFDPYRPL